MMRPDVWIVEFKYIKADEKQNEEVLDKLESEASKQLEKYAKSHKDRPCHKIFVAATNDRILRMKEI